MFNVISTPRRRRLRRVLVAAPVIAMGMSATATAASTVVDFDGLGPSIGQAAIDEVNASLDGTGATYSAGSVTADFPSLGGGVIIALTTPSGDDMRVDFDQNIDSVSAYLSGAGGSATLAVALDSAGNQVDLVTGASSATLTVNGPCIRTVIFENTSLAFLLDDLVFDEMAHDSGCDDDADGVINADDLCADTEVGVDDFASGLKDNRFGSNAAGEFVSGDGVSSGLTLADTGGCSASQIIDAADLGSGHVRFGLSRGALLDWVASV